MQLGPEGFEKVYIFIHRKEWIFMKKLLEMWKNQYDIDFLFDDAYMHCPVKDYSVYIYTITIILL